MYISIYIYIHIYIYICICTYLYMYIYIHTHTHRHTRIHVHKYVYTYVYIYEYLHMYTYTYICCLQQITTNTPAILILCHCLWVSPNSLFASETNRLRENTETNTHAIIITVIISPIEKHSPSLVTRWQRPTGCLIL